MTDKDEKHTLMIKLGVAIFILALLSGIVAIVLLITTAKPQKPLTNNELIPDIIITRWHNLAYLQINT